MNYELISMMIPTLFIITPLLVAFLAWKVCGLYKRDLRRFLEESADVELLTKEEHALQSYLDDLINPLP